MTNQSEAERYLEFALTCEEYARKAKDPEAAQAFRKAAEAWRDLAAKKSDQEEK